MRSTSPSFRPEATYSYHVDGHVKSRRITFHPALPTCRKQVPMLWWAHRNNWETHRPEAIALASMTSWLVRHGRLGIPHSTRSRNVGRNRWVLPIRVKRSSASGLFDEEFVRNQDDKYNYRLLKQGGRFYFALRFAPVTTVGHHCANCGAILPIRCLKVRVAKHPRQMRCASLCRSLLCSVCLSRYFCRHFGRSRPLILMLYLIADSTASVALARQHGWRYLPALLVAHPPCMLPMGWDFWPA